MSLSDKKFITVTLNPCIDKSVYLDTFRSGALNRTQRTEYKAGGKGINVSRAFLKLNVPTVAVAFCGSMNGARLDKIVSDEAIPHLWCTTASETRMNIKIIDEKNGSYTEINEKGAAVTSDEYSALITALKELFPVCKALFLCGSLPLGVEKNAYADIISMANKENIPVLLDADDEALALGLKAKPYLIKPNAYELSRLTGCEIKTKADAIDASARIFAETGTRILCTLGADGAVYTDESGFYTIDAPNVTIANPTGAGDTFLAAFAAAHFASATPMEALKNANNTVALMLK